jgi:hypothetical protein
MHVDCSLRNVTDELGRSAPTVNPTCRTRPSGSGVQRELWRAELGCWRAAKMNVFGLSCRRLRIQRRNQGQRWQQRDAEGTSPGHAASGTVGLAIMFGTAGFIIGIRAYRGNFMRKRWCGCGVFPHLDMSED